MTDSLDTAWIAMRAARELQREVDRITERAVTKVETTFPDVPTTADELLSRWTARDAEYAKDRTPMAPEMAESVRMMRMQEANRLPNIAQRGRMFARAKSWTPPVHADFGGLRDWL